MATVDVPPEGRGPDATDRRLIDRLHGPWPLTPRPFAAVGAEIGLPEDEVIGRLRMLLAQGVLTRFGPIYQVERRGGEILLAALAVPAADVARVASEVGAWPEVTHIDVREHHFNLWLVIATDSPAGAQAVVGRVAAQSGLAVATFAKEREYPVGSLERAASERGNAEPGFDRALMAATASGLPLLPRPCEALGAMLGVSEVKVRTRLADMLAEGLIRRIGAVLNHDRLGNVTHGLTVWDVADAQVDALAEQVGALPGVSHCYRRTRQRPLWPYNLFATVHGRTRSDVEQQVRLIDTLLGQACATHEVLYAAASLKKAGLRLKGS